MNLINQHIDKIQELCKKYHVAELYVFGSIVSGENNTTSDIDLLVLFSGVDPFEYFDNYMDLKFELKKLLTHEIDLVEMQTIKNPILKKSINRNKILIYGGEDSKVAV